MMNIRTLIRWTGLALVPVFGACKDAPTTPAAQTTGARASFATVADSGIGGGGGPGNQSHFVANGDFGFATWFSSDTIGGVSQGFTVGQVSVNRGGAVNNPQAFLFYFIEHCSDAFVCTFLGGSGQIPAGDVAGGGRALRLSTNTSGNPNFFTFAGSPGVIGVDWAANGLFTQRSSGTSEVTFSGFHQHSSGVSTSASANPSGSVVGMVISGGTSGNIGTNQNVVIDISH